MRIAIYHNLPSGGGKRALSEFTRRLAANHSIDVYTLKSADHDFADLRPLVDSYRVYGFEPLPLLHSPFGRINQSIRTLDLHRVRAMNRQIAADIDRGGYDICFVHPCRFEISPSVLRYLRRLPSVYYCQESLRRFYEPMPVRPYDRPRKNHRQILERIDPQPAVYQRAIKQQDFENLRSASRVLVNSHFSQAAIRSIYQVEARVCYLGVDANMFRPLSLPKAGFVISVGSLTPLKGFDFLIQMVSCLPSKERPELVIASNFQNPPEREYLLSLAQQYGVNLRLEGNVSEEALVRLYNQAAVTAYAPIREPFGFVPLESLACEVPVLAVKEGGVQETIQDGLSGFLVERDAALFASALQKLLKNPGLREHFGSQGRQMVLTDWSWDKSVSSLETIFREVRNSHL